MSVTVTREGNEAALKITVAAKEVDKSFKQAVARIASQVRIPGFGHGNIIICPGRAVIVFCREARALHIVRIYPSGKAGM